MNPTIKLPETPPRSKNVESIAEKVRSIANCKNK